jgi:short-subunit dehydrogenase
LVTPPFERLYAASKHAVEAISEALYLELRRFGVRVHMTEPGASPTNFGGNVFTEPNFDAASFSPYWALGERFQQALGPLSASASTQEPALVADAVVKAIADPQTPFRQLVGADANMLVSAYRAAPDFQSFLAAILAHLGMADMFEATTPYP